LLVGALHLAKNSVKESSQKSYQSAWNKWEKFVQKYFTNSINSQNNNKMQKLTISQKSQTDSSLQNSTNAKYTPNYKNMQYSELLEKLLMFVTYCAYELKCNVRSIPSIMSSIRYGMVTRLVQCCTAFDDEILKAVKLGASKLPAPAYRTRIPCTLDMINHIIQVNTSIAATMTQVMLATGISMAFFLCLRSSEYVSRTIIPIEDTHQFLSSAVEFMLNDGTRTFIASHQLHNFDFGQFSILKFSMLHAKNIRNDYGVPMWFSTTDASGQSVPFVRLVYLWARHSQRLGSDPFLSFRANGKLKCLLYKDIQGAVKQAATVFNLDATWFDTHSLRMSAPTIARAAHVSPTNIMSMGRWKSLPASLLYQAQSTQLNNSILSVVNNPTLFTTEDILLSRVLASNSKSATSTVRRF
jgi:hypothetical protein